MNRIIPIIAVAALAAVAVGTASATDSTSTCTLTTFSYTGLRPYLVGIGTPNWRPAQPPTSAPCGSPAPAQARFFALLGKSPKHPTTAEIRTLVLAAVATDQADLAEISTLQSEAAAAYNAEMHCGIAPNPANLCDNQSLPVTASSVTVPPSLSPSLIQTDQAAVQALLPR
jgi:hypothetical protein